MPNPVGLALGGTDSLCGNLQIRVVVVPADSVSVRGTLLQGWLRCVT